MCVLLRLFYDWLMVLERYFVGLRFGVFGCYCFVGWTRLFCSLVVILVVASCFVFGVCVAFGIGFACWFDLLWVAYLWLV